MKKIENIPGHQKQCSYSLLQLHVQRYILITANSEYFYIYIPNSKEK